MSTPYNLSEDKHVESKLVPCLDEGSIPSSSTKKNRYFSGFFNLKYDEQSSISEKGRLKASG